MNTTVGDHADIKSDIALLKLTEAVAVAGVAPAARYTATDELGMVLTFVGRGGNVTGRYKATFS